MDLRLRTQRCNDAIGRIACPSPSDIVAEEDEILLYLFDESNHRVVGAVEDQNLTAVVRYREDAEKSW